MADSTAIAWTDATFNPWIGCTKISPGCDHCYAEVLDRRHRWQGDTHWGAGKPRMRTSAAYWQRPLKWQKLAEKGLLPDGKTPRGDRRPRIFCASLADVFDNEAPDEWRRDLWDLIELTPALDWLLLTKRISNAMRMLRTVDWASSPRWSVWLGATIVNQEEAERDVQKLLAIPARRRFVSYEPALGEVDWSRWLDITWSPTLRAWKQLHGMSGMKKIDWIIVGGESTQGAAARYFRTEWAMRTVSMCRAAGVPVFVKQMGSRVLDRNDAGFDGCDTRSWPLRPDCCDPDVEHDVHGYQENWQGADCRIRLVDRAGAEPAEWPEVLRVRQFPA